MIRLRIAATTRWLGARGSRPHGPEDSSRCLATLWASVAERRPAVAVGESSRVCADESGCPATAVCWAGACRCPPEWDPCGTGRCHYLPMSHDHCGGCGVACGPDQLCSNGRCV